MVSEQPARPRARDAILLLLKTHGKLTAQSLADKLGVTAVAVRKHLDALEHDGLVVVTAVKQARGRPVLCYELTAAADRRFPQGYRQLSLDLIDDLIESDGPAKFEQLLNTRFARVRRQRLDPLPTLADKVRELARLQNDDGYMVTLEERPDAFVLREHNCPIIEVAQRHPTVCRCESEFFAQALAAPVTRDGSILEGGPCCAYVVEKPATE
ncbi:MAG: HTH domain-containing protein [Dehalococcoidia bacterium]|nr:HTH domain-containing protein [Dehalococcoidia bacterium]